MIFMDLDQTPEKYTQLISDIRKFIAMERKREPDNIVYGRVKRVDKAENLLNIKSEKNFNFDAGHLVLINRKRAKVIDTYGSKIKIQLKNVSGFNVGDRLRIETGLKNIILNRLDYTIKKMEHNKLDSLNRGILDTIIGTIKPTYKNLNDDFLSDSLNPSQKEAVKRSLEAQNFHLIVGPPGTGKTYVILELIHNLLKSDQKILITAWTNVAVDNILERLDPSWDDVVTRVGSI